MFCALSRLGGFRLLKLGAKILELVFMAQAGQLPFMLLRSLGAFELIVKGETLIFGRGSLRDLGTQLLLGNVFRTLAFRWHRRTGSPIP